MLDLVGEMSQLAKQDGYIVSMVPPESYLDPTTSKFDGSLLHSYPEWESSITFNYHGRNGYAYLLAKYGQTQVASSIEVTNDEFKTVRKLSSTHVETFDLISIQLYESWSHILYNVTAAPNATRQTSADYLINWVPQVLSGWYVDFAADPSYSDFPSQHISISATAFCIGLANGWAEKKTILVMPEEAGAAYYALSEMGQAPRGFVFWAIESEGWIPPGQTAPLFMAAGLNEFLHTRPLN